MTKPVKNIKRGMLVYVSAVSSMLQGPKTVREMADECGMRRTPNMRMAVAELFDAGLAHIAGWKPASRHGGSPPALWAFGPGPDIAPTLSGGRVTAKKKCVRPEMLAFIEAIRTINGARATTREISEASGMSMHQAQSFIRALRKGRAVHIAAWEYAGYTRAAVYTLGRGENARRPDRTDKREIEARYYEKRRAREIQQRMLSAIAGNAPTFNQAQSA
jgi:FaeA-like protein